MNRKKESYYSQPIVAKSQ